MKHLSLLVLALLASCGKKEPYAPNERGQEMLAPSPPPAPEPTAAEEPAPPPAEPDVEPPDSRRPDPVAGIHDRLADRGDNPPDAVSMMVYRETLPDSGSAAVDLVPIPGGTFTIGSPDDEPGRDADEGPPVEIAISPFWIGKHELRWNLYHAFLEDTEGADEITGSPAGEGSRFPVAAVTHRDAGRFCQWLSAKTGRFYRLPTEAEWEFACRADTTSAWSFGDDPGGLADHAWSKEDAGESAAKVGQKSPNSRGLHDMHGNLAEWCLDGYLPDAYAAWESGARDPWHPGTPGGAHVIRGGHFHQGGPESLRSAARAGATDAAPWIGFRVVRPLAIPTPEEMRRAWNTEPSE